MSDSDVVLTAVFGPFDLAGFTYNFNYASFGIASPCGYETYAGSDNLTNNTTVRLRSPMVSEIPDGYEFGGWFLTSDCSGSPIEEVIIDVTGTGLAMQAAEGGSANNVVYAKWIPKKSEDPVTPSGDPDNPGGNSGGKSGGDSGTPDPWKYDPAPSNPAVVPQNDSGSGADSDSGAEASTRATSSDGSNQPRMAATGDGLPIQSFAILAVISAVLAFVARPRSSKR